MTLRTTLSSSDTADLAAVIEAAADARLERTGQAGVAGGRQPVHTVYVPADVADATTVATWGRHARRLLDDHAAQPTDLASAMDVPSALAARVRGRVAAKLATEPVEDLRIDFEDGYGRRDDEEEDRHARHAARIAAATGAPSAGPAETAAVPGSAPDSHIDPTAPPFVGIRVKSFAEGHHGRAIRTLDGFLTTLLDERGGSLPDGLIITFPKVVAAVHVEAFAALLDRLEHALGLPERRLVFEIQVETTASVVDHSGRIALPALVDAAAGRLVGAHLGVFDYTAACGLPAAQQRLDHPACDFARHIMQVSLAGTGVRLSDGSTNRVPADDTGAPVTAVWRHHARLVRRSLGHGFFQGWDMHPSHLVSRFVAVHAFHLQHLDAALRRLAGWTARRRDPRTGGAERPAAAGGRAGADRDTTVDEPATVRALLASLRRAVECGAVDATHVSAATGVDPAVLLGGDPDAATVAGDDARSHP